jgi:hypothetical protein
LALCATLAALVAGAAISAYAVEYNTHRLSVRLDGDLLHVSTPNFSFLSGKSLERLRDGNSVAFIAQLTVASSPNYLIPDERAGARFAVSYAIWDDKFSVTTITDRPEQKRSISHLSGPDAEAWCLDQLTISRAKLPVDRPFYVQLELRVEDPRDQSGLIGETGLSLKRMVEIFSQPVRQKQDHWAPWIAGPIRLEDLLKGTHG